ncbi:LacI family DNA-binding transcriptional regulator [Isoptericola sp. NPDC057191]|uniref:LacI family DNA-binding transcriptional regulator n=1 Tax=Isoptericola sp. NPDC057191 TaxID=3346041 RepID=UPI0036430B0E
MRDQAVDRDSGATARTGRPRMVDVARLAGVSQATVSFVLNDRADIPVAAATRQRILDAAEQLGYRLNRAAQELKLARSTTVGVVSYGIASHPFAGRTLLGIQNAARARGYVCMVVDVGDEPDHGADADAVASLLDRVVAGLIFASPGTLAVQTPTLDPGVRTAFSSCWPVDPAGAGDVRAVILPDERQGGNAAAAAVFDAGHRDVLFLGGTPREWATVERERGLDDAARAAGIDPASIPRVYGDYSARSGYRLAAEAFDRRRYTAVVCGNDLMALGALLLLHERGLRIPDDVSLVGYDDQEALAAELHPPLTTVALPHYEMGALALDALLDDEPLGRLAVTCPPVERASVATPRA